MMFELRPIHDNAKSFYGKALVDYDNGRKTLISYSTKVCYIDAKGAHVLEIRSNTTLRHIKEFLKQGGFLVGSKSQIIKDYSGGAA